MFDIISIKEENRFMIFLYFTIVLTFCRFMVFMKKLII